MGIENKVRIFNVEHHSISSRHLCGSHLVDALYLVCGERGFFYNPGRGARDQCCHKPCNIFDLQNYCN
uniref:Insulin n=1 Tax=Periophthalmus magnuspinnatus TaxID=409849 RepID=A0A3B4AXA6_9GOBI